MEEYKNKTDLIKHIFKVVNITNKYYIVIGDGGDIPPILEKIGFSGKVINNGKNNEFITAENINKIIEKCNEFDFLSITHFNSWYIWNSLLDKYSPNIVHIKNIFPSEIELSPYNSQQYKDNYCKVSKASYNKLGIKKKYTMLIADKENIFFIKTDIAPKNWVKSSQIYQNSNINENNTLLADYILNNEEINIKNKIEIIKNGYPDTFKIIIKYITLNIVKIYVKRTDKNDGWGQDLIINIYGEQDKKEKVLIGKSFMGEKCFIYFTNIQLYI